MLVSIVVPIFNMEKYISTCLDSLLHQTYEPLEIVLVDDGSTDGSRTICEEYAKTHNNILLICQNNKGVAAARNAGIDASSGEFFMFVDGDDVLNKNAVDLLVRDAQKYNVDIASAIIDSTRSVDDLSCFIEKDIEYNSEVITLNSNGAICQFLNNGSSTTTARLFSRHVIQMVRFVEGRKYHEDRYFMFRCYLNGRSFSSRETIVYLQFRHSDSSSGIYKEYRDDSIYFSELINDEVKAVYPELSQLAEKNNITTYLNNIHGLVRKQLSKDIKIDTFFKLRTRILSFDRSIKRTLPFKNRIELVLLHTGYYLYSLFVKVFDLLFRCF